MANSVSEVLLTETHLEALREDIDPATSSGTRHDAGAIVDFWGVVRELEDEREIEGIDYEAHAVMAERQLRLIAQDAAAKFQLHKVIVYHRIGFVRAGEASLFLQVRSSRRAAAFEASQWIVDELKTKVPIWKKPVFTKATAKQAVAES